MSVQVAWMGKEEEKPQPSLAQGQLPRVQENKKGSDTDSFWQSLSTRTFAWSGTESKAEVKGSDGLRASGC